MKKIFIILSMICYAYVCYAQVTENFSDEDFVSKPLWTPDNPNNWTVVNGQLRSNSSTASSSFFITTPSSKALNVQWDFYVQLQFNTSGLNFVDVYLISEQENLLSPTNSGYFVRIGGTPDEISLCKMTAGTVSVLINGTDGVTNRTNNPLRIKVIRDADHQWSLAYDAAGGTNYIIDGTIIDNSLSISNFFGIRIQQSTSGFFNKHLFDDFYAGDIVVDSDPPLVNAVQVLSNTQLSILFNEALDPTQARISGNYIANNNLGSPAVAELQPDEKTVLLTFSQPFTNGLMNSLQIKGVEDLYGNTIVTASELFLFFQPMPVTSKDIILTEIFADPSPQIGLSEAEFIEIHNRSTNPIDLNGWQFSDGSSTATLPSKIIMPNAYWVICGTANASAFSPENTLGVSNFSTLNNSGESLTLKSVEGFLIDSVHYALGWYQDENKQEGGWTLELIDTNNTCGEENNWTASIDPAGGTPGKVNSVNANNPDLNGPKLLTATVVNPNELLLRFDEKLRKELNSVEFIFTPQLDVVASSFTSLSLREIKLVLQHDLLHGQFYNLEIRNLYDCNGNLIPEEHSSTSIAMPLPGAPGDILITEIFADPDPQIGLPEAEFIELYNQSAYPIDLSEWTFSDGNSIAVLPAQIILPGQYWIICAATNASAFIPLGNTLGVSNFPSLNNAGESLTLKTNTGLLIDSVNYSLTWYRDENKKEGGWTLELINFNNLCLAEDNWTASTDSKGGTPGKVNSVNDNTLDTSGPKLLAVTEINSNELVLLFDERLQKEITASSFLISPSIEVLSATYISSSLKNQIKLILTNPLQTGEHYTIALKDLQDCNGNLIQEAHSKSDFTLPVPAEFRDILITEIFADPDPQVGLPEAEFIEIYNRSANPVELKDWKFSDGSSVATFPAQIIQPNQYWTICATANATLFSSHGNILAVSNFPTLNNSGESLTLKNNSGQLIDSLHYSLEWYQDRDKQEGGWTLELIDQSNPCGDEQNWTSSINPIGGTPGKENSVKGSNADITGPKLLSAFSINPGELVLTFDERLENSLSGVSFAFEPLLNVITVAYADASQQRIKVTFSDQLQARSVYVVVIKNLRDCSGNLIREEFSRIRFGLTGSAVTKDIIFTEVFADPDPQIGLPQTEFVEIFNRSANPIDVSNWNFSDGNSVATLPSQIILPNQYWIICSSTNASLFSSSGNALSISNFPTLNNGGESLTLKTGEGTLIDSINYSLDWYRDENKEEGGWTLELIDTNNPCGEEENWTASEDPSGGTPGKINSVNANKPDLTGPALLSVSVVSSTEVILQFNEKLERDLATVGFNLTPQANLASASFTSASLREIKLTFWQNLSPRQLYQLQITNLRDCNGNFIQEDFNQQSFALPETAEPGDLLINEVLFNPRPGGTDFVEIINTSAKYINLKGWLLANQEEEAFINLKSIIGSDYIIAPQRYLVFTTDGDLLKNHYPNSVESNFLNTALPSLNDDNGSIALLSDQGIAFDHFAYEDGYHYPLLKDKEGVSLERISLSQPAGNPENWKSASAASGYATPGYLNSNSRTENPIDENAVQIEPEIFSPTIPGQDFALINYRFEQSALAANVKIVDHQGRLIKQIANNETLNFEGFYRWDGDREDGSKARMGYYFVWFEVFDLGGMVSTYRKRVVIGR